MTKNGQSKSPEEILDEMENKRIGKQLYAERFIRKDVRNDEEDYYEKDKTDKYS